MWYRTTSAPSNRWKTISMTPKVSRERPTGKPSHKVRPPAFRADPRIGAQVRRFHEMPALESPFRELQN